MSDTGQVRRYGLYERDTNGDFDAHMEEESKGKYVLASDYDSMQQRAERAEKALAEALKDAQRYRWLRDCDAEYWGVQGKSQHDAGPPEDGKIFSGTITFVGWMCGPALDAAIDAALTPSPTGDGK